MQRLFKGGARRGLALDGWETFLPKHDCFAVDAGTRRAMPAPGKQNGISYSSEEDETHGLIILSA